MVELTVELMVVYMVALWAYKLAAYLAALKDILLAALREYV
jgi:hypothetical protein